MDEFTEQAKKHLCQRINEVRDEFQNPTRAEKKAEMENLNRILFSLPDEDRVWLDNHMTEDLFLANDVCEALYMTGLKDGLRLLKLLTI